MFNKGTLIAVFFLFSGISLLYGQTDPVINEISSGFALADGKEIAKYFGPSVSISILNDERVYSRSHGEMMLKGFLDKIIPISSKIHQYLPSSNGSKYGIILLRCNKGDYRISVSLKKSTDKYTITELRIDAI